MRLPFKITLLLLLTLFTSFKIIASPWDWQFKPYLGIDTQGRYIPLEDAYGDRHFQDTYLAPNLFIGTTINQLISLEVSWLKSLKRHRESFYGPNEPILGFDTTLTHIDEASFHVANSRVDGWMINLIGEYPVWENTSAFLRLGVSLLRLHLRTRQFESEPPLDAPFPSAVEWDTGHKGLFSIGLGLKHMFMRCFGVRAQIGWEDTSRLHARTIVDPTLPPPTTPAHFYDVKAKDGGFVSIGVFYQFPDSLFS